MRRIALLLTVVAAAAQAATPRVHADFPSHVDPGARYVVYSHGRIVEGDDETPVSADFGRYDFPGIREALTRNGDFDLIARHRPKEKGSYITAIASSNLADLRVNTALLAACTDGLPSREPLVLAGNVLSIYETSDEAGSCRGLKDHAAADLHFEEVDLSTGLRHGAFYRPIEAWLAPLLAWISHTNR